MAVEGEHDVVEVEHFLVDQFCSEVALFLGSSCHCHQVRDQEAGHTLVST